MGAGVECAFNVNGRCEIAATCGDLAYLQKHGGLDPSEFDSRLVARLDEIGWGMPFLAYCAQVGPVISYPCSAGIEVVDVRICGHFVTTEQLNRGFSYMKRLLEPVNISPVAIRQE